MVNLRGEPGSISSKMELEGLILQFVSRICFCFVLEKRGWIGEATFCFRNLILILDIVYISYPEKFTGRIRRLKMFAKKKNNGSRLCQYKIGYTYAAVAVRLYFTREWPKLIDELYYPDSTKLRCDGLSAFIKLYEFFKNCSELYRKMEMQAMHFRYCRTTNVHSKANLFLFHNVRYNVLKLSTLNERKESADYLLKVPCFQRKGKGHCFKNQIRNQERQNSVRETSTCL